MLFFKRFIIFVIMFVGGILIVKYREKLARLFGKNDIAEKYLGAGGTYNMYILIGMIVMFVGAAILIGQCGYAGL